MAGSATEAMNNLGLIPGGVDAIIIDIGLPDRRGDALLREIWALHSAMPIVLATGQSTGEIQHIFKNEERLAFVTKPYIAESLIEALRGCFTRLVERPGQIRDYPGLRGAMFANEGIGGQFEPFGKELRR